MGWRSQAGGGILMDAHVLDKILYWFGDPSSFSYADDSQGGVEANCKAEMTFDRGDESFTGSLFLSKAIELKNRIVFPPTCPSWVSDPQSARFNDLAAPYYEERASGGVGLIIIGGTHVHRSSIAAPLAQPGLWDDSQIVGFALKNLGMMVTVNQRLDFDQIELIVREVALQMS